MAVSLRERESIAYRLALAVVVHYFVGVDEFCVVLQHINARQHFLIEPALHLIVS